MWMCGQAKGALCLKSPSPWLTGAYSAQAQKVTPVGNLNFIFSDGGGWGDDVFGGRGGAGEDGG